MQRLSSGNNGGLLSKFPLFIWALSTLTLLLLAFFGAEMSGGQALRGLQKEAEQGNFLSTYAEYESVQIGQSFRLSTVDYFSECFVLQITISESSPMETGRIMSDPTLPACTDLGKVIRGEEQPKFFVSYDRFWNLQAFALRAGLAFLDFQQLRAVLFIAPLLLLCVVITQLIYMGRREDKVEIAVLMLLVADLVFSSLSIGLAFTNLTGILALLIVGTSLRNGPRRALLVAMGGIHAAFSHLFYPLFFGLLISVLARSMRGIDYRKATWEGLCFLSGWTIAFTGKLVESYFSLNSDLAEGVQTRFTSDFTQVLFGVWNGLYLQIAPYPLRALGFLLIFGIMFSKLNVIRSWPVPVLWKYRYTLLPFMMFVAWAFGLGGHHTHGWAYMTFIMGAFYISSVTIELGEHGRQSRLAS